MKKRLASLFIAGSFVGGLVPIAVHAQDVIGDGSAEIKVNGSIGLDNTDPTETIDEESEDWINVTLDTATIFYNISGRTNIESPTYTIKNNSGRPVDVTITKFEKTNSESISEISSLKFVSPEASDTALISSGSVTDFETTPARLFTLANNEGKLTSAGESTSASETTFGYQGVLSSSTAAKSAPTFDLTLQLDAVSWTAP